MKFFSRGLEAEPDYAGQGAGLLEGGRASFAGVPLWLHAGCGQTVASADRPREHDGCEQPGDWHPVLIAAGAVTRPPRDIDYVERRTAAALRLGPGNTHIERVYRWVGPGGETLEALPASAALDNYRREVAVKASSVSHWQAVQ